MHIEDYEKKVDERIEMNKIRTKGKLEIYLIQREKFQHTGDHKISQSVQIVVMIQ